MRRYKTGYNCRGVSGQMNGPMHAPMHAPINAPMDLIWVSGRVPYQSRVALHVLLRDELAGDAAKLVVHDAGTLLTRLRHLLDRLPEKTRSSPTRFRSIFFFFARLEAQVTVQTSPTRSDIGRERCGQTS